MRFTAPGPGKATVRASARLSRSIRMTVGSASRTVSRAGTATLTVAPSRAARRALRSRRRLATTLKIAFKPAGGGAVSRQVRRVPVEAAVEMVLRGEITDSMSVIALLRFALMQLKTQ